jgi:cytochrome c5
MSDPHSNHDDGPHEGPIKTPKQVIIAVVFGFIVPILVIVLLVTQVVVENRPAAGSDGLTPEAIAKRIQPVGTVLVKDPNDVAAMKTGEQVYSSQCMACHNSGAAGAPKIADIAAWGPRIAQGYEALLTSALKGKGAMGAQGGGDYSDLEIGRAVVYLVNQSGGKLPEPALPKPATTDASSEAK